MYKLIIFFSVLAFIGCSDCTYQYDLWVKNDSSTVITIEYKNADVRNRSGSGFVDLKPGDYQKIFSSEDLTANNCKGIDASHCSLITDHVRIKNSRGQTSNIMWCSEDYKLEWVDIQQGEFSVEVKDEDF